MKQLHKPVFFAVFLLSLLLDGAANAATMPMALGSGYIRVPVESLKERRFHQVVHQNYDFSCGSAALATLLKFHYNRPVEEQEVLEAMFKVGNQEKIRKQGFSLLDMKKYLASLGMRSDGYRVTLDRLAKAHIPAIVLINNHGYMHFVVIKGVTKTHVLIGDPALGKRVMVRKDFEPMWNGIIFAIRDQQKDARLTFNQDEDWQVHEKAILSVAMSNQSLASFTSNISITPNYYR